MSYDRALELVQKIQAAGVYATVDPRSATPPCVVIEPPNRTYDLGCGYTAAWQMYIWVPNLNADSWKQLDAMAGAVMGVVDVRTMNKTQYSTGPDVPASLAYLVEYQEAVEWP